MRFLKRMLGLILALLFIICTVPFSASAVNADEIKGTIDQQIRTFAKSINKSNADASAAMALATHGLTGRGKKLSVGKSHALTATLWNSEMLQSGMIDTCTAAIEYMQNLDLSFLQNILFLCDWNASDSNYRAIIYMSPEDKWNTVDFKLTYPVHTGKRNAYDESLDWMAGRTSVDLLFTRKKVTADAVTYEVACTVRDRFDFSTSSNSGFKNLISGTGAILFREFDWESKVSFEITVPYSCDHSTGNYHWSYDAENYVMNSVVSDEFAENETTRYTYTNSKGDVSYYYKLDNTVRLRHDEPWVMEYTVRNPGCFAFSALPKHTVSHPFLLNYRRHNLIFQQKETNDTSYFFHSYGAQFDSLSSKQLYTIRLENIINESGKNMVYLTIYNNDTQETVLDKAPMDDYYEEVENEFILTSTESGGVSGWDFFINYIGDYNYRFGADYFDLRIWENGEGAEPESRFKDTVTEPSCTAKGYTTHTCSLCGYSYNDSYAPKTAHSFGNWSYTTEPTCTESGSELRACKTCSHTETREVESTGHSYENGTCTVCGDRIVTPGDTTGDGSVNALDLVRLKKYLSGADVELDAAAADATGDGKVNALDLVRLKKYLAGADVILG